LVKENYCLYLFALPYITIVGFIYMIDSDRRPLTSLSQIVQISSGSCLQIGTDSVDADFL
jgi:hypothetical protein